MRLSLACALLAAALLPPALLAGCAPRMAVPEPDVAYAGMVRPLEIPFTLDRSRIVVDASLNGRQGYRLAVDTGMTDSHLLTLETADELSLETIPGGAGYDSGGRRFDLLESLLDRLDVGDLRLTGERVAVLDMPDETMLLSGGGRLAGVLGDSLLEDFTVTLDFEAQRMGLQPGPALLPEGPGVILPLVWTGNLLATRLRLNGRPVLVMVDTGDFHTLTLFDDTAERLGVRPKPGAEMELPVLGAAGPYQLRLAQVRRLELEGVELRDLPAAIGPRGQGLPAQIGGRIGIGLLANFQVVMDARAGRMILVPRTGQSLFGPAFPPAGTFPRRQASEQ